MAPKKIFANTDDWFAERGFIRKGPKYPYWVKKLPYDMDLIFSCDAIPLSSGLIDSRFDFFSRYPKLSKLHVSLHANSSTSGTPSGVLRALGLGATGFHGLWEPGYRPLEPSGTGPLWSEFLANLDPALVKIEEEITRNRDYRDDVATSDLWKVAGYPFSEMFVALHVEDYEEAERLLNTTDWHHAINPQNIPPRTGKLTLDEEVQQATGLLADYIATHRKDR